MDNTKEFVGKVRSLMERVEGNMSPYEAKLNEQTRIDEATSKNRIQISRDEILDMLDKADDEQNEKNSGLFATITYVKPAAILKTRRAVDTEKLTNALNKHSDMSDSDWHKNLTSFRDAEKSSTRNPIATIITTARYHLRWHTKKEYNREYSEYASALRTLRMRNGIGLDSDGMLGDNRNQRRDFDSTDSATENQTGNIARDVNLKHLIGKPKYTAYIVNEEGKIVEEIPDDIMWAIHEKRKKKGGVEASVKQVLTGQALEEYEKTKNELDASFDGRNLLYDLILCICCSIDGVSYYYINDAIVSSIAKGSSVKVNPADMVEIAEKQLGESFDVLQGFAN